MPAKSPALPLLIQRQAMHLVMFGFVSAHRSALPGVSIDKVIDIFLKFWGTDQVKPNTLKATYFTMQNEHLDLQRTAPEDKYWRMTATVDGKEVVFTMKAPTPEAAKADLKDQLERYSLTFGNIEEDRPISPAA